MERILEVKHATVDFNGFVAVNDFSLRVNKGEVHVVIGPNGAGKSTLIDLITGKTMLKAGKIVYKGEKISEKSVNEIAARCGIGRKFQGPNVFHEMTVYENIELALKGYYTIGRNLFFKKSKVTEEKIMSVLEQIGLENKKKHYVRELSHGEKQWVEIGMVLAQDNELIILDEPTTGMTEDETYKTGELIKRLKGERTIIVSEHDMDFVKQVAERITVMNHGEFLAEGTYAEIEKNPEVIRVYLKKGDDSHERNSSS